MAENLKLDKTLPVCVVDVYLYEDDTNIGINGIGDWYSITETLDKLNISRRTLYDRINKGELESTKDEKYRFVWIDATVMGNEMCTDTNEKQENDIVKELINQVEYFKSKVEKLETDLREQRLRHSTTIFKIINQNQMLIRGVKKPFWRKFFNSITVI